MCVEASCGYGTNLGGDSKDKVFITRASHGSALMPESSFIPGFE